MCMYMMYFKVNESNFMMMMKAEIVNGDHDDGTFTALYIGHLRHYFVLSTHELASTLSWMMDWLLLLSFKH